MQNNAFLPNKLSVVDSSITAQADHTPITGLVNMMTLMILVMMSMIVVVMVMVMILVKMVMISMMMMIKPPWLSQ